MTLRAAAALAVLSLFPAVALAQSAENVLLVVNETSPASVQIGDYYAKLRLIPERNIVRLKTAEVEAVSRAVYEASIEAPIADALARGLLQDQILFVVLTKGVPLRVDGTTGVSGTVASVDSELTLLYRKMVGTPTPVAGRFDNPMFLGDKPVSAAVPFSRFNSDLYLVTRLDGFTVDEVKKLIDRGMAPARDGRIVLDQKATVIDRGGDAWLVEAADRLTAANQGSRVELEKTRAIAAVSGPVLGYFSWGSNDPANQRRATGLAFAPGAVGGLFVSTDGRTFREPHPEWRPAPAGSSTGGQSLVADLIREGITGVSGHVTEPYLDAIVRPQILFPVYLAGFNLAESFYLAMPYLSWQDLVIGDPLCAPFAGAPLPQDKIHGGVDADTGLPAVFAERRLALIKSPDVKIDAIKLQLKALSTRAQGRPEAEWRELLERVTAMEPKMLGAHLLLAESAETRGDFDEAVARYRAVLKANPDHAIALNNLAYTLAERKHAPKEALPFAQRAYQLSGQAPATADTLGWTYHLLGDDAAAKPLLDRAVRSLSRDIDVLVHAATVAAGLNDLPRARALVDAAVKVDPKAAERADVKALNAKIRGPQGQKASLR